MEFLLFSAYIIFPFLHLAMGEKSENSSECCENASCVQDRIQDILDNLTIGIMVGNSNISINPIRHDEPFIFHVDIPLFNYVITTSDNSFIFANSKVSDTSLKTTGPNYGITFTTTTPKFVHTAIYHIVGTMKKLEGINDEEMKLNETGVLTSSADNMVFQNDITLGIEEKEGEKVVVVRSYDVDLQHLESFHADFTNLFGGLDEKKTAKFLKLENDNLEQIVQNSGPDIREEFAILFNDVARRFIDGTPFQSLCSGRE